MQEKRIVWRVTRCHTMIHWVAAAQIGKVLWENAPASFKNKYFINNFMKGITGASNKVLYGGCAILKQIRLGFEIYCVNVKGGPACSLFVKDYLRLFCRQTQVFLNFEASLRDHWIKPMLLSCHTPRSRADIEIIFSGRLFSSFRRHVYVKEAFSQTTRKQLSRCLHSPSESN